MARRSLWGTVALLLALLFVTTHGLRGPASQVEGQEARTTLRSRGGSRFNPKAIEGLEVTSAPFSPSSPAPNRSRSNRRGGSRAEDATRPERVATTTPKSRRDHDRDIKLSAAGSGRKSSGSPAQPASPERRRTSPAFVARKLSTQIPQREAAVIPVTEPTKEVKSNERRVGPIPSKENDEPRRIGLFRTRNGAGRKGSSTSTTTEEAEIVTTEEFNSNKQFDTTGPSVFSGTTEIPRSRTGRKIQTTLSSRDLKRGLPSSGRYSSRKNPERTSGQTAERRSDDFSAKRRPDIVSSGSESVSVDVPLTGDVTTRSRIDNSLATSSSRVSETATEFSSQRKASAESDRRARGRGRFNDDKNSEAASTPRSSSRRGSSRLSEVSPVDNSLDKNSRSRNEAPRSKSGESKARNSERNEETSRGRGRGQQTTSRSSSVSSRSGNAERNSGRNKNAERRGRPAEIKVTTETKISTSEGRGRSRVKSRAIGTNVVPPTTTSAPVETTITTTTAKATTTSTEIPVTSTTTSTAKPTRAQDRADTTTEGRTQGNRGRVTTVPTAGRKAFKEDFFNHGLGFRGRKIATEAPPASTEAQVTAQRNPSTESPPRGNPGWTLKRRPSYHQEETVTESGAAVISNEIPTNQAGLTTTPSVAKTSRGGKNVKKTSGQSKVNVDFEESDNYPQEFKAKLALLKTGQESTSRPGLGGLSKKRPTTDPQFVARSRQKLESARKLIHRPETSNNVGSEEEKRATTTTSASTTRKSTEAATKRPSKFAVTPKKPNERKASNIAKRFGATKTNSRPENSAQISTTRKAENIFSRTPKAQRKSEETETTTTSDIDENSLIDSSTLPYSTETESTTQATQPPKPQILSRRAKEIPRQGISTTTRRSRAWTAQHLDKNFQEPRPKKSGESATRRSAGSSTTTRKTRAWNVAYIDRNWQEPTPKYTTTQSSTSTTTTKKSRVWNAAHLDKNWQDPTKSAKSVTNGLPTIEGHSTVSRGRSKSQIPEATTPSVTEKISDATSGNRYTRKKTEVFKPFEATPKSSTTEEPVQSARRREFRPRTATYRRHSEPPAVMVVNAVPAEKSSSTGNSIAITPKTPVKFHATVRGSGENSSSQRSARQEPTLNVRISGADGNENSVGQSSGIVGTSNGASGNADSNIFSPTRSTLLLNSNATLLEQLRSTVAPLLNALGNRTPIFSTAYRDVANNSNSGARVTPSGAPPRFSARYKGAELFVRRPNVLEPAGPFLTSSTTPFTPTESDSVLNTRLGIGSNAAGNSATASPPTIVTPSNVNTQGGRLIQDRERDEASRSREAGGQRSTVYIGQEKFINYWSNGSPADTNNSRLVTVKINSVASSVNEGPASSSGSQQASFDILPNSQSGGGGQVTAPPGFPWKDPLDQIFGITTQSAIITASVASNTLEDTSPSRSPIMSPPINPLAEVFSPSVATFSPTTSDTSTTTTTLAPTTTTTTTTTAAPTTTTTTTAAPTTTTTTPAPTTTTTTTTTTTPAPTTTTTTTTTTTPAPTTTTTTTTTPAPTTTTTTTTTPAPTSTTTTTTTPAPATTTAAATTPTATTVAPTTMDGPRQTAFGTTFDDLAFLNSLLQQPTTGGSGGATPKTLTEVEQLLANKILSLALADPGPTRSPKAIQSSNVSPNSVFSDLSPGPSSRPIIIDLLQTTSTTARPIPTRAPTISIVTPTVTTAKPPQTTAAPVRTTLAPQTTRKPQSQVVITARPVAPRRPTTTQAPLGFGAGILQALFGGNFFGTPTTTQRPVQATWRPVQTAKPVQTTIKPVQTTTKPVQTTTKPVQTTTKPVQTTTKPIQTTLAPIRTTSIQSPVIHVTPRNIETSKVQSNTPNSLSSGGKPLITTTTFRTSTYSNEDDAKFLAALLKATGQGGVKLGGGLNTQDDARFLAELLKVAEQQGGAKRGSTTTTTTTTTTAPSTQGLSIDDEAFLRTILSGQASVQPAAANSQAISDAALLAALLKAQGIEPSTPPNRLREQLQSATGNALQATRPPATSRPRPIPVTTKKLATPKPQAPQPIWSPSSTYPPPLFSNFANFGSAPERPRAESGAEAPAGDGSVRSQVFNAAIGATRAFSQFLGAAITGAAQQFQSFVRNGTS